MNEEPHVHDHSLFTIPPVCNSCLTEAFRAAQLELPLSTQPWANVPHIGCVELGPVFRAFPNSWPFLELFRNPEQTCEKNVTIGFAGRFLFKRRQRGAVLKPAPIAAVTAVAGDRTGDE